MSSSQVWLLTAVYGSEEIQDIKLVHNTEESTLAGPRSLCCWWWVLMTKDRKPLCPLRWFFDLGGPKARPVMPCTSQSPHSVWHGPAPSYPSPRTLICIPFMPTQSRSQPGTLAACGRRHALPNKSSSVGPEHDDWDEQHKSSLPSRNQGHDVDRERALLGTVEDEALWPHIATSWHPEPNWLVTHGWMLMLFSIEVCAVLHKRLY